MRWGLASKRTSRSASNQADDSHVLATALFALHLSILVVWPIIYAAGIGFVLDPRGSSHYRMIRIFCEFRYVEIIKFRAEISCETPLERALLYPAVGAIMGAWLGSVVYPLDWERPWQVRRCDDQHARSS
jgi:phosphatidylinositol glycan class F